MAALWFALWCHRIIISFVQENILRVCCFFVIYYHVKMSRGVCKTYPNYFLLPRSYKRIHETAARMSLKFHFLHSHLDFIPDNLGVINKFLSGFDDSQETLLKIYILEWKHQRHLLSSMHIPWGKNLMKYGIILFDNVYSLFDSEVKLS